MRHNHATARSVCNMGEELQQDVLRIGGATLDAVLSSALES